MLNAELSAAVAYRDAKVLVVDDEKGIRELLSGELSHQGHTVHVAADGVLALERLAKEHYQVVVCDINMPGVSGLELLRTIQQDYPGTDVILMTGYGTLEVAVKAMKEGAYDFVQKPFDLSELLALVDKCLERKDLKATTAFYSASQSIFRSIRIQELLPVIADLATDVFAADSVSIMLYDSFGKLVTAHTVGLSADRKQTCLTLAARTIAETLVDDHPVLLTPPFSSGSPFFGVTDAQFKSAIVARFSMDGNSLGALFVSRTCSEEPFQAPDLRRASILSSQISQAVYNANLYRRLDSTNEGLRKANDQIKEMQEDLIQSEKLAGIGRLAAGVAHELNNPLSGVLGFTQLLMETSSTMSVQQRSDLDVIFAQGKRCQTIIQNMLKFSRRTELKKQSVEIGSLLQTTLELVRYQFSTSSIDLILKIAPSLPPIWADPTQLQQVFINLLTNARQAVEGRDAATIALEAVLREGRVIISVADNGCGIPDELRDKIFDPFFTTKSVGQGTGLGLSICHGIILQHEGIIRVDSQKDVGTTVTIELPAATAPKPEAV